MEVYLYYANHLDTCNNVFSSFRRADQWLRRYSLTGLLVRMEVDYSVCDDPGAADRFTGLEEGLSEKERREITFHNECHWHYVNGECDPLDDEADFESNA